MGHCIVDPVGCPEVWLASFLELGIVHSTCPPQRSLTRFLKGFTIVTVSICPFVILQDDTQDINLSHSRCRLSTQHFICHFVLVPPWPCCTLLTFFTLWNRLHTRQLIQQGLKSYCVSYGLLATIRYVPVTLSTVKCVYFSGSVFISV